MLLLLSGCYQPYNKVDEFINNLVSQDVIKIKISHMPEFFRAFEIEKQDDIEKIVDYIKNLSTSKIAMPPDNSGSGGGYDLEFHYEGDEKADVTILGNSCIIIENQTKELIYEEAIAFDNLV